MVFLGTYEHTIDDKKRLQIPSEMRDQILKEASSGSPIESDKPVYLIAMPGNEQNIRLYTEKEWEKLAEELGKSPMDPAELLEIESVVYGLASRVELDKQGRIRIPATLKERVGLGNDVLIVGSKDHIEVRDAKVWATALEAKLKARPELLGNLRLALKPRPSAPATPAGPTA